MEFLNDVPFSFNAASCRGTSLGDTLLSEVLYWEQKEKVLYILCMNRIVFIYLYVEYGKIYSFISPVVLINGTIPF